MRLLLSSCVVVLVLVLAGGCGSDDGGTQPTGTGGNAAAGTGGAAGANAAGAAGRPLGGDCGIPADGTACLSADSQGCNTFWGPGYTPDFVKGACAAPFQVKAGPCPVEGFYATCIVRDASGNYTATSILAEGGEPIYSAREKQCGAANGNFCVY